MNQLIINAEGLEGNRRLQKDGYVYFGFCEENADFNQLDCVVYLRDLDTSDPKIM